MQLRKTSKLTPSAIALHVSRAAVETFDLLNTNLRLRLQEPHLYQCEGEKRVKMRLYKRKITVADDEVTSAVHLMLRQSLVPCFLGESTISPHDCKLTVVNSHHPILPLGFRIRTSRRLEPSFPKIPQHHPFQVLRNLSSLFRRLLPLPTNHLRLHSAKMGFPRHIHERSQRPRSRMSSHVAQRRQALLRWILRQYVRSRSRPLHPRNSRRSLPIHLRSPTVF